jgi:hypothetical protein
MALAPQDQNDCLRVSKDLYGQAVRVSKKTGIQILREFARVASNLDEFCDEGDFVKARVIIKWMETCIKNFHKKYTLGFCTRSREYFCATFPESDGCKGG